MPAGKRVKGFIRNGFTLIVMMGRDTMSRPSEIKSVSLVRNIRLGSPKMGF